jgi:hypothetical protein
MTEEDWEFDLLGLSAEVWPDFEIASNTVPAVLAFIPARHTSVFEIKVLRSISTPQRRGAS